MNHRQAILPALLLSAAFACRASAQTVPPQSEPSANAPAPASEPAAEAPAKPQPKRYTVPAGTKVLLQLRSGINTRSARPGDGVYLVSTFPVVVGTRVLIPAGVYVQGVVDNVIRAGRVKGRAQLNMHFTSIIFPNGTVVEIPGMVNSLPGAKDQEMKGSEGTIQERGDKGRNAGKTCRGCHSRWRHDRLHRRPGCRPPCRRRTDRPWRGPCHYWTRRSLYPRL